MNLPCISCYFLSLIKFSMQAIFVHSFPARYFFPINIMIFSMQVMLLGFVLLGRSLEERARIRASSDMNELLVSNYLLLILCSLYMIQEFDGVSFLNIDGGAYILLI